jgi:hypothetical protein
METSEQINEIVAALAKAQGTMKPAEKDSINPMYKHKHESLHSIRECAREPLSSNGIFMSQDVQTTEKSVSVWTILMHSSGQRMTYGPYILYLTKNDPHSVASATTYARKQSMKSALAITASDDIDDDDGNAAMLSHIQQPYKEGLISDAQLKYLCSLTDASTQEKMLAFYKIEDLSQLTISQAKACIDKAKGSVKNG